jgi:hypothetical protein
MAFRQHASRKRRPGTRPGRSSWKPTVETLEDRTLLSFSAPINYAAGTSPQDMVAGDFTGTGILDLATVSPGGAVNILLGNGDGSFQPPRAFPTGPHAYAIAAADLTGTGILDLVVTHNDSANVQHPATTISVLMGNGDGTFQAPVDYDIGANDFNNAVNPDAVAIADLNGDGIPDIVTANFGTFSELGFTPGTTVSVLPGNGDGTFGPARVFDTGVYPTSVAVGDFAGNGRLSIVTADEGFTGLSGDVGFLQGNGDGTFRDPVFLGLGVSAASRSVAVADLNGNGRLDIVTANDSANGGSVSVLLGRGNNTFQNAIVSPASNDPGFNPLRVIVRNFSGAGHADVAVSGFLGTKPPGLYILAGTGNGTFQAPVGFEAGNLPNALIAGDFTGSGLSDLAVANISGSNVSIFLAKPDGFFVTPSNVPLGVGATDLHAADLTGTGIPDLVTVNPQTNTVTVQLGQGDGTFQAPTAYAVGRKPRSVTVADLTGSGVLDLIVVNEGDRTLSVLMGNGAGTFQPAQTIAPVLDDAAIPERVAVGDFDGDGKPDLAILERFMNGQNDRSGVLVLHGNGDGTFSQNLPDRTVPFFVNDFLTNFILQAADLRHNGTLDLVLGGGLPGVAVLLGNGDGTFGVPRFLSTGHFTPNVARAAVVADVNGDGIPDILVADDEVGNPGNLSVLLGNGDGTFKPAVLYPVDFAPLSLTVGDFFGDGTLGVATANFNRETVSVLRGNGDGTFGPATNYLVGSSPGQIASGDFNGDGAPDLAVLHTSQTRGDLSIVFNHTDGTAPARHTAARTRRTRPDATLGHALAQTPAPLSLDTTASAPRVGQLLFPDAYFAALAGAEHEGGLPNLRPEARISARTMHAADNQDPEWVALIDW